MRSAFSFHGLLVCGVAACAHERTEGPSQPASPSHEERRGGSPGGASPPTATAHTAKSCGEIAMTRAGVIETGLGANHPEVVRLDALLAQCADKTPSPDECRHVMSELTEVTTRGYGPNHPTTRALRAKLELCPK